MKKILLLLATFSLNTYAADFTLKLSPKAPTPIKLSGSGVYTPTAGTTYLRLRMVGGGASGSALGAAGTDGSDSSFGSLIARGGKAGGPVGINSGGQGGDGGTVSLGSLVGLGVTGGSGHDSTWLGSVPTGPGAAGGVAALGGAGGSTLNSGRDGHEGAVESGSGGSGGTSGQGSAGGAGGGAGGFIDVIIPSPLDTSYNYSVGQGGSVPPRDGNLIGNKAGPGGSGFIEITEY